MNIPSNISLALEWKDKKGSMTLTEFAESYGLTMPAVSARIQRGRKELKAPLINSLHDNKPTSPDEFDLYVLDQKGDAQDLLKELYDHTICATNAEKYIAGVRVHLKYKLKYGVADREIDEMEEVATKADGTRTTKRFLMLSEEDGNDPIRIMELMGYDPLQWDLISCKVRRNYWDVTIKDAKKKGVKHTNHAYMCVVTCKPIQNLITTDIVRKTFEGLQPPELVKIKYNLKGLYMLELPIMDFHLGKLAWADETGEDHYDLKIAVELYKKTVLDLLGKATRTQLPIERIIYPIGQDYFHVDDREGRTTSGTYVDNEGRWQKMYQEGVELLVWTVEQLRAVAPVECMYVPGNHDDMLSYCATEHVAAWYRDIEEVQVDLSPQSRKYVRYGKNLIGFSHGKKEKKRIHHLMQIERPEDWGETVFREWHLGDEHHEESEEVGGVIIRRISAITATDAWHAELGFKGALRKAQAFIWDKNLGKQYTIDSNVIVETNWQ